MRGGDVWLQKLAKHTSSGCPTQRVPFSIQKFNPEHFVFFRPLIAALRTENPKVPVGAMAIPLVPFEIRF